MSPTFAHDASGITATASETPAAAKAPVFTVGLSFLGGALALSALHPQLATSAVLAGAASAGSLYLAGWRASRSDQARNLPLWIDRLIQGSLNALLLWMAQLIVALGLFGGASMPLALVAPAVLVAFLILLVIEAAIAIALCRIVGRRMSALGGDITAAIVIDNRLFGGLGSLDR